MTQYEAITMAVVFRVGERIALSAIIVVIACIVMIAFWRSVQRIELMTSGERFGGAGTIVLSTPIFVLLALVGYTYISFSNPIAVSFSNENNKTDTTERQNSSLDTFTGIATERTASGDAPPADNTAFDRLRAIDIVRSLNCLAGDHSEFSTKVLDDFNRAKLQLLRPVWLDGWGSYDAFADRVMGRVAQAPDPKALAVFESRHEICTDLSR